MLMGKAMSRADKVIYIVGTYRLPLRQEVLDSFRRRIKRARPCDAHLLFEEQAAMLLVRYLYPTVLAELRAAADARAVDAVLGTWLKFAQQAMYRSDLGLINMCLFDDEILPLIDDVERIVREKFPAAAVPRIKAPAHGCGA